VKEGEPILKVTVDDGEVHFTGCPKGCTLTVSEVNGQVVVTPSTKDTVIATFVSNAPPSQTNGGGSTGDSTAVTDAKIAQQKAEQEAKDAKTAQQKAEGEAKDAKSAQTKAEGELAAAEAKIRAPEWVKKLNGLQTDGTDKRTVTVRHPRGQSKAIILTDKKQPASITLSGWEGFELRETTTSFGGRTYLYTNLDAPTDNGAKREFWKVHGVGGLMAVIDASGKVTCAAANGSCGGSEVIQITGNSLEPETDIDRDTTGHQYGKLTIDATFGGTEGKLTRLRNAGEAGDPVVFPTIPAARKALTEKYVTFDSNDKPTFTNQDGWTFVADDATDPHDRDHDETYLYFGYWMNTPPDAREAPDFQWIYDGGNSITSSGLNRLEGIATYDGHAAGQYAINIDGGDKNHGHFTATASLTVDFGNASTPGFVTTGTIGNFDAPNYPKANQWSITLGGSPTLSSPTVRGSIGGSDSSIVLPVSGNWGATLYGVTNTGYSSDNGGNKPAGATCQSTGCAAEVAGFAGWFKASSVTNDDEGVAIAGTFAAE